MHCTCNYDANCKQKENFRTHTLCDVWLTNLKKKISYLDSDVWLTKICGYQCPPSPPHAKCQACWEGVAWVEPATTSKLLTRLHSHIKEKTVLLFGPISLMYVCCVLGRTLTSYHNNMEYNYAHLKMGYSLFWVLFGKKSGDHCCGFGCVQSPLRVDCWFLLADEWWVRYTCISKCVYTHCPNELAIIKIQHVL